MSSFEATLAFAYFSEDHSYWNFRVCVLIICMLYCRSLKLIGNCCRLLQRSMRYQLCQHLLFSRTGNRFVATEIVISVLWSFWCCSFSIFLFSAWKPLLWHSTSKALFCKIFSCGNSRDCFGDWAWPRRTCGKSGCLRNCSLSAAGIFFYSFVK